MEKENRKPAKHVDIQKESEHKKEENKPKFKMVMSARGYMRPEHSTRCSNCQERISIPIKQTEVTCPFCDMLYRISWVTPDQPRVRGPVWSALPGPGPWPKGWPGDLDEDGRPIKQ